MQPKPEGPAQGGQHPRRSDVVGARSVIARRVVVDEQHSAGAIGQRALDQVTVVEFDSRVSAGALGRADIVSARVVEGDDKGLRGGPREEGERARQEAAVSGPDKPRYESERILARTRRW